MSSSSKIKSEYPTISITGHNDGDNEEYNSKSESSNDQSLSHDNDMDYNLGGGVTDVEDFNSQGEIESITTKPHASRLSSTNPLATKTLTIKKNDVDYDATDIEDYNDSDDSDCDDKSKIYPELKLSLREFLQHGLQEQAIVNNEVQEKVEIKAGNFMQAQNLNSADDYITDCEDYDTDSNIEWGCEKSVCCDLDSVVDNQGRVCIADAAVPTLAREESDENEDISIFNDITDMASALSDATGASVQGISEDEMLEVSGDEQICRIAFSGSSDESDQDVHFAKFVIKANKVPSIDVTFIAAKNSISPIKQATSPLSNMSSSGFFLDVANKYEEVLTDIEGLDDSAAENDSFDSEDDVDKPIPRAVILASEDDGGSLTDIEDLFCEDDSNIATAIEPLAVSLQALPIPHREIIVLNEDKYGDTVTSVEPMHDEYQFGIYNSNKDDVPTDTEDYSCEDSFERRPSLVEELLTTSNLIEGEVIVLNEMFKPALNKRTELHPNGESITDVEEIYVAGTNRRKKLKTRTMSNKNLLAPKCNENTNFLGVTMATTATKTKDGGATDIEDMDLSESGLPLNVNQIYTRRDSTLTAKSSDQLITDVEDLTADDSISDLSNVDLAQVDINTEGVKQYICNSVNIVLSKEKDFSAVGFVKDCDQLHYARKFPQEGDLHCMQPFILKTIQNEESGCNSQQHTDIEDIPMPSDIENDVHDAVNRIKECNSSSREFNDILNESYTVVHERSVSAFNIDAEKLHIKDARDIRDACTDVEYMESDESVARGGN